VPPDRNRQRRVPPNVMRSAVAPAKSDSVRPADRNVCAVR
jgi:hypothetical protein